MGGRTTYTDEIAAEICERIANGEFLRVICRDEHMPNWSTVYRWMEANPEFAQRIARARDMGFDAIAEETVILARTPCLGVIEKLEPQPTGAVDEDGNKVTEMRVVERRHEDMLGHRKLQVDTNFKALAKWCAKRYGDRLELAGDANAPLTVNITRLAPEEPK